MRRAGAVIGLVAVIGSLCLTGLAHDDWESYADEFKSISYSRNDGTLDWASNWTEVNDDGTVSGGDVHVANDPYCADDPCLNLYASILQLQPIAAQRCADTSVFSSVEISFDMRRRFPVIVVGPTLRVKVSTNGGGSWSTIATYPLNVNDGSVQHKVFTGDWISEDFMLKFEGSGLLNGEVFIDNVVVTGEPAETGTTTTSTTTTTKPTTTTTKPTTTTTSDPTTTTTRPTTTTTGGGTTSTSVGSTTSTTVPGISTTTVPGQTTTTDDRSTTTTVAPGGNGGPPPGSDGPGNPGLRDTGTGIQGGFQASLFGEMAPMAVIDPGDAVLDYKMAVEVIEASWGWMLLLGGVIAWSVVKGLDRRKTPPGARVVTEP